MDEPREVLTSALLLISEQKSEDEVLEGLVRAKRAIMTEIRAKTDGVCRESFRGSIKSILRYGVVRFGMSWTKGYAFWRLVHQLDEIFHVIKYGQSEEAEGLHLPGGMVQVNPAWFPTTHAPTAEPSLAQDQDFEKVHSILLTRLPHTDLLNGVLLTYFGYGFSMEDSVTAIGICGVSFLDLGHCVPIGVIELPGIVENIVRRSALPPAAPKYWLPNTDDSQIISRAKKLCYTDTEQRPFVHLNLVTERAKKLMQYDRTPGSEIEPKRLYTGRAMSRMQSDGMGSFGCEIQKKGGEDKQGQRYGISASHVVNPMPVSSQTPVTIKLSAPGGLNLLAKLFAECEIALSRLSTDEVKAVSEAKIAQLVDVWEKRSFGKQVAFGGPGADNAGWREDWTLFSLEAQWAPLSTFDVERTLDLVRVCIEELYGKGPSPAVKGYRKMPKEREKAFKVGAATALTVGTIRNTKTLTYWKSTSTASYVGAAATDIDVCRMQAFWPDDDIEANCDRGDSGSTIWGLSACGKGLDLIGMLVVRWNENGPNGKGVGLFVPAHAMFQQLFANTGEEWTVVTDEEEEGV